MKKNKFLSVLLALALAVSVIIPTISALSVPAYAEGESENNGMHIEKTAQKNADGTYTITLEAYATGEKVITSVDKDVPTDIVLVLDQSGSMDEDMNTYDFRAYSGRNNDAYYRLRHNGGSGNLYYQLSDGSYATVSVTRTQGESTYNYVQCPSDWKNYTYRDNDDDYWKYANNLYVKVGDTYKSVTVSYEESGFIIKTYTYYYTFPDDTVVTSVGNDGQPGRNNFDGKGPVYYLAGITPGEYAYEYTCTDSSGNTVYIGTSTGASTVPTGFTLYERYSTGTQTRLEALKTAVTTFADSVKTKAAGEDGFLGTADDINHRIAVVGFASGTTYNGTNYHYGNTELFIGSDSYTYNAGDKNSPTHRESAQSHYGSAFQNMNTQAGYDNVIASKNALDANGGTIIDLGMEMANGILNANPIPSGEKRNRVIVVFTDGVPGWSGYDSTVASNAITQADTARSNGANVYAVGIFDGADATSEGNQNGNNTQKANWFMQNLSDNKGTPQTPSFYLSASDSDTLNNIFKQIADNIESGGSSTTLDENTVIKDIIAPAFTLPTGATASDITLKTYACTGADGNGNYTWSENADVMGATASISGSQVSVTGFDFAENWCGTVDNNGTKTYRGNKLVISFKVEERPGFLGGNGVYTNTSAGVYENADASTPVMVFERPTVDVDIDSAVAVAQDENIYFGAYVENTVTLEQIKAGVVVTVGKTSTNPGISLDLDADNFGLESWQNEYVDITVELLDKNGNVISAGQFENITDDTEFKVRVTVSPKKPGTATEQSATGEGTIHVFFPEITYKDTTHYYGETIPTEFASYQVGGIKWRNKTGQYTTADTIDGKDVVMSTDAPTLDITYTPAQTGTFGKTDVPVKADVTRIGLVNAQAGKNLNEHCYFVHNNCSDCSREQTYTDGNPAFMLHVKTCSLTITKEGGAAGESYIFKVFKDGAPYTEVTVVGNSSVTIKELPVGAYTIAEDTGWSWRYGTQSYSENVANLHIIVNDTMTADSAVITCTNTNTSDKWLNGFSAVVKNVFGQNKTNS